MALYKAYVRDTVHVWDATRLGVLVEIIKASFKDPSVNVQTAVSRKKMITHTFEYM